MIVCPRLRKADQPVIRSHLLSPSIRLLHTQLLRFEVQAAASGHEKCAKRVLLYHSNSPVLVRLELPICS